MPTLPMSCIGDGESNQTNGVGRPARSFRQQGAELADALDVLPRFVISEHRGGNEPVNHLFLGRQNNARLIANPPLQFPCEVTLLDLQLSAFQSRFHLAQQFFGTCRLQEVAPGSLRERLNRQPRILAPRQHEHGSIRKTLLDAPHQFKTRLAGHANISRDKINPTALQNAPGVGRAGGAIVVVAGVGKPTVQQAANVRLVVHDQNSRFVA